MKGLKPLTCYVQMPPQEEGPIVTYPIPAENACSCSRNREFPEGTNGWVRAKITTEVLLGGVDEEQPG